jgi:hypothetical protein
MRIGLCRLYLFFNVWSGFWQLYLLVLSKLHFAHFTQSFAPNLVIFLKCLAFGPLFISRNIHRIKPTNTLMLKLYFVHTLRLTSDMFRSIFIIFRKLVNNNKASFAIRSTNAQGSSGFFINTFLNSFYPDMFRHMVAILWRSWVPDKIPK